MSWFLTPKSMLQCEMDWKSTWIGLRGKPRAMGSRGERSVSNSALEKLQSNTWKEVSSVGSMLLQAETGRRAFLAERTG